MQRDLDSFKRAQAQAAGLKRDPEAERRELRLMTQAEVSVEKLTRDPNWDHFLRLIQGALNEISKGVEAWRGVLNSPLIVNHDDVMRAKVMVAALDGRREALDWVQGLPNALRDTGKAARKLLVEMPEGRKQDDAGDASS